MSGQALIDLARRATRNTFASPAVLTSGGVAYALDGIYRREPITVVDESGHAIESVRQVLDVRTAALTVTPRPRDTVVVTDDAGAERTHTVTAVEEPCVGTTLLILGRSS